MRLHGAQSSEVNERSSIREDIVMREISRLQALCEGCIISVLDVNCGLLQLALKILKSTTVRPSQIQYWATEREPTRIAAVRANLEKFRAFRCFELMERAPWDLGELKPGSINLIAFNNALHHEDLLDYPRIFSSLNSLVSRTRGEICIVDMEVLPSGVNEPYAEVLKGSDVWQVLSAGGFKPEISVHHKKVPVYQLHMKHVSTVNFSAMRARIKRLVEKRMGDFLRERRSIQGVGIEQGKRWNEVNARIARYADQLDLLRNQSRQPRSVPMWRSTYFRSARA